MYCQNCGLQVVESTQRCPQCGMPTRSVSARELHDDPAMRMLLPIGRTPWAIAAGYAGLFAATCFLAPLALLLGGIAIYDLKRHPEKHGWGRAIFGTVMGVIGTAVLAFAIGSTLLTR